jgi:dihydrofolate reductase
MRRLRYNVAMSLDGYIAGPNGEYDWIPSDPTLDFAALFESFDLFLMGRKTWAVLQAQGLDNPLRNAPVVVISTTLAEDPATGVTVIRERVPEAVAELKAAAGKDIWLFGGGQLFRTLLDAGLVDTVEVAVMPILLGAGIQLLAPGDLAHALTLVSCESLPSGIVLLTYTAQQTRTT